MIPDTLASNAPRGGWEFNETVAENFDNHVANSVAGYQEIQNTITRVSDWFTPNNGIVADLGCSTGTTLNSIQRRHPTRKLHLHGYDEAPAMIRAATRKLYEKANPENTVNLHRRNIVTEPFEHGNADLNISVFTVQFLPKAERVNVYRKIREHTKPGGVLLIAEKTIPDDPRWAVISTEISWEDKEIAGIEPREILAKAVSLRGVLNPVEETVLTSELTTAGWEAPFTLYAHFQWKLYGVFNGGA